MYEDWSHKQQVSDRREYPRYACPGRVTLGVVNSLAHQSGTIVDLSGGGCLVRLQNPANFEAHATLDLNFQAGYHSFRATGTTSRHDESGCLIAILFDKVNIRGRIGLLALLTHLEGSSSW